MEGLIKKYILSRTDGKPINPEDEYFVLKVKGEGDPYHIEACKAALSAYCKYMDNCGQLPKLTQDLRRRYLND